MIFKKKLTFVEHKVIDKGDKTYHKLTFKDENGVYIDSLVNDYEHYKKLIVEKDYICAFNFSKNPKQNYAIRFILVGVE